MPRLCVEPQRGSGLVSGDPGRRGRDVEQSHGGDPGDVRGARRREDSTEGPGARGGQLGVEDLETVEEDAGGDSRVTDVPDDEVVHRREQRDGDIGKDAVRHRAVEALLGHEGPVHEDLDVVVDDGLGVGASLQADDEPGRIGGGGVEAIEGKGSSGAREHAEGSRGVAVALARVRVRRVELRESPGGTGGGRAATIPGVRAAVIGRRWRCLRPRHGGDGAVGGGDGPRVDVLQAVVVGRAVRESRVVQGQLGTWRRRRLGSPRSAGVRAVPPAASTAGA